MLTKPSRTPMLRYADNLQRFWRLCWGPHWDSRLSYLFHIEHLYALREAYDPPRRARPFQSSLF